MQHHVYLSPGMFGFARLASYDYFTHVEAALAARFRLAGEAIEVHVVDVLPTASVRRRAAKLAEVIAETALGKGPIHLLGHSTGGLDARLVASPSSRLSIRDEALAWIPRLRSVTLMNTPNYGTPLASFFATAYGQRALYALSAFTVIGLSLGARPLATASVLLRILGRGNRAMGIELRALDASVDSLVGLFDDASKPEVRTYLDAIKKDQGAMLQLTPEAMEMMLAGFEDRSGVTYQSTVSMAPTPSTRKWLATLGHPSRALSLALFTAIHRITSRHVKAYPCAIESPSVGGANGSDRDEATLVAALGASPDLDANDGVVPIRSQLWGTLVWAGLGDHLDVLGHYHGDEREPAAVRHHDWLTSGSSFDHTHFDALMDAIAHGMLAAAGVTSARERRAM